MNFAEILQLESMLIQYNITLIQSLPTTVWSLIFYCALYEYMYPYEYNGHWPMSQIPIQQMIF